MQGFDLSNPPFKKSSLSPLSPLEIIAALKIECYQIDNQLKNDRL